MVDMELVSLLVSPPTTSLKCRQGRSYVRDEVDSLEISSRTTRRNLVYYFENLVSWEPWLPRHDGLCLPDRAPDRSV